MKILIKNGTLISMDEAKDKYEVKDILIEDTKIIKIENNILDDADKIIDAKNKIVMPGLINCHTHLGMSIFRATNDNLNLNDWLNNMIWPIEDNMTDEDIYYTTLLSCLEMIKTGTTCSNDMYFGTKGSLKALKEVKIRQLFSRCLMGNGNNDSQTRINEFLTMYKENIDNELIKFALTPHALYTCNEAYLKQIEKIASEYNLPIHIHLSENIDEVNGTIKTYGKNPINVLENLNYLNHKLIIAHGTFINDDELKILNGKDVSIVHNPVSNLNLGCGIADISKYKKYNINLCLGTDGQGSGNNLNMFYHMSLVDLLQKGKHQDPTIFSSYEVLKMATINGAKALGMEDSIGSLEVGKNADIIILNLNQIETFPTVDLITQVVHNVIPSNIETTIINGNILMENHELKLNIDIDNLYKNIENIIKRLKK